MSTPDMSPVDKAVDQLGEHFDTVQILVTKREGDRTFAACRQSGCIYARYGQMREWLITVDEQTRRSAPHPYGSLDDRTTGDAQP